MDWVSGVFPTAAKKAIPFVSGFASGCLNRGWAVCNRCRPICNITVPVVVVVVVVARCWNRQKLGVHTQIGEAVTRAAAISPKVGERDP